MGRARRAWPSRPVGSCSSCKVCGYIPAWLFPTAATVLFLTSATLLLLLLPLLLLLWLPRFVQLLPGDTTVEVAVDECCAEADAADGAAREAGAGRRGGRRGSSSCHHQPPS